jgi:hypothetical protein
MYVSKGFYFDRDADHRVLPARQWIMVCFSARPDIARNVLSSLRAMSASYRLSITGRTGARERRLDGVLI